MNAPQSDGAAAPGRRLRPFFTAACIYTRERSGASLARIADLIGLDTTVSVQRFEAGVTFPTENLERYAAAYAHDAQIDPRDLIRLAVDWWKQHGQPPQTAREERQHGTRPEPTASDVLDAIRQTERKERDAAASRPTSTPRKRAAGE